MKTTTTLIVCLALGFALSGCMTTGSTGSAKLIGKTVTFTTSQPAPAEFDGWTFFWQAPQLERFDADLEYVVLRPDGTELYVHDCTGLSPMGNVRSDFSKEVAGGDPAVFHGKNIRIKLRATTGRLRCFGSGSFAFHKKGDDGKINWRQSFTQVDADVN